ncbi:PBP1A family penicillin-binding protein [Gracilibacillus sp. YIM 98692]|uniref:transglycosylase domain-containing protein n=1 Tax=Gracilibacillus sp. YIM 98692 TaxID=2663532 RepID=UPI001F099786|nr:PBP1A family penicillin-binding protein [Gracilibacillus sp. YIM 98692]
MLQKLAILKRYKWIIIMLFSMVILSLLGYLFILFGGRFVFDEKAVILPQTSKVVAEDGTVIGKLYTENREYAAIDQMPGHLKEAFLSIEDQRFYEHAGISFPAVARAVYRDILAMSKVEGASTITQQLAKNLFLHNDKTWMRKTKEVMASLYLEQNYSKDKILELYLNEVYFAHGIYGVNTAAKFYFNKKIENVTVDEAALLAGMVKAPNHYSPHREPKKAKQRRDLVLEQMAKAGVISTEDLLDYQEKTVKIKPMEEERNPWLDDYLDHVLMEAERDYDLSRNALKRGGYTIEVYMDTTVQKIAYQHFQNDDFFPASNDEVQGAFVLMEQETGHLNALIGGRRFQLGDTNYVHASMQPGSVMKPIAVYGPAMETGDYQPYDFLPDEKQEVNGYEVANADGEYAGEVTMYEALVQSKNAPAVWLFDQIGIGYSKTFLEKLDIDLPDNGLSIALGGLETGLTPIDVTESYRPFIHQGEWMESTSIAAIYDDQDKQLTLKEPKTVDVFSPQVAWNMIEMMEDVVISGTAQAGDYTKALAGKTGSTQHPQVHGKIKDAWFTGVTPQYVATTWIGFDKATEQNYLTAGSVAPTKLTKAILTDVDKRRPLADSFSPPSNVESLPKPIDLPVITDLKAELSIGGWALMQGKLHWTAGNDNRVIYRVYEQTEEEDIFIGEVQGKGSYTLNVLQFFRTGNYYVVPYNPLTDRLGQKSNVVNLKFDF